MTAVQLLNLALLKIGVSKGVTDVTDASREAWTGAQLHDHMLRATLRQFPWSFATAYLALTQVQGPVAGTSTDPANGDWTYAYRWPTDCLFVRRVVPPGQLARIPNGADPVPFRIGRDATGLLVYTNQPTAQIEYTVIDCDHLWADDLFLDAFTWRLAAALAPSMARDDKILQRCMQMFALTFNLATAVSSREQQQDVDNDAEWVRAR